MSLSRKLLVIGGFILLLLVLASADGLLTWDMLRIPERNGADGGVAKKPEPDPVAVAESRGFTAVETNEEFLLQKILDPGSLLTSRVLLKNDDRFAAVAWIDSATVKRTFTTLKERLRESFSPALKDLIDESQSQQGKATREVLAFHDDAILLDRALFVRIRERLYEFHVPNGKEAEIDGLLDALTD